MKYSFYISMSILAITNSLCFIVNWKNWEINISNEAILLSVDGFFFAFAGINIYSIFNTNIENEKKMLNDIIKKYDAELRLSSSGLKFPQNIHNVYQSCQYLISSNSNVEPKISPHIAPKTSPFVRQASQRKRSSSTMVYFRFSKIVMWSLMYELSIQGSLYTIYVSDQVLYITSPRG